MENLDKKLRKFTAKERAEIEGLVERIRNRNFTGLDCKKLKGLRNLFRVRKGHIRIIFEIEKAKESTIILIERRHENTYKF